MEFQIVFAILLLGVVSGHGDEKQTTKFPDQNDPILAAAGRNELFYNISSGWYDNAVVMAKDFVNKNEKDEIKNAVDLSIAHGSSNVLGFAYKLWAGGEKQIVEDLFPPQYRMIYNDSLIRFTNSKYNMALDYNRLENSDGTKNLHGKELDPNNNDYIWKLEPVIDSSDDSIVFKIRLANEARYITLGSKADDDNEYEAFISTDSDTARHRWWLRPVNFNNRISFRITNLGQYHALKLGNEVYDGKRIAFSTDSDYYTHPEQNSWKVDIITESRS